MDKKIIQQISNYLKESFTKHGFVQKEDSFERVSLKNRTKRHNRLIFLKKLGRNA